MDQILPWWRNDALLTVHDAAEDFALPVGLMDGPALDGPAVVLDHLGPAVMVDVAQALLFRRLQLAADSPGVAAAAVDVLVVHNGDDARLGQVQHSPGDDLMAGSAIPLLQLENVIIEGPGVGGEPAGRNQQAVGEQVGQGFAGHGAGLAGWKAEPPQHGGLEVLADLMGDGPLVALLAGFGAEEDLSLAGRPLGPPALRLAAIQADHHAQVPLRQHNGIHRDLSLFPTR